MEERMGLDVVNIRLVRENTIYPDRKASDAEAAVRIMREELADYDREVFCILNLATDGRVINMNIVSVGTLSEAIVSPREVFKSSILSNAGGIIALHNHPSGNTIPSKEDYDTTKRLVEAGKILNIDVVDHIIVGGNIGRTYSFKAGNVLGKSYDEVLRERAYER